MKTRNLIGMGLALAMAGTGAVRAAELLPEGSRLRVVGALDSETAQALAERLRPGKIRTVVLQDAAGDSAEVAEALARVIREASVDTEFDGLCQAACAYAFLAGRQRRIGSALQVDALLVPVHTRPTPDDLAARPRGGDTPRVLTDFTPDGPAGSAPATALAVPAPRKKWQPEQGVLFTATPTLFGSMFNTFYCDGSQGRDLSRCEPLSDADPYKLGVLTP